MSRMLIKSIVVGLACLCLAACVTRREFVVAPEASGIVIDAETGMPVQGAGLRFVGVEGIAAVTTGPEGRFALPGLMEKRTIVAFPIGGVYRDSTLVQASAPGKAEAFASAAFIQGGQRAAALYRVTVLMFPPDAGKTPLHALMRDCVDGPVQDHALHLSDFVSGIDPASPPAWLDDEAAEALQEHLSRALPASSFLSCEQMSEAFAVFRAQTEPLAVLQQAAYSELPAPHITHSPMPGNE